MPEPERLSRNPSGGKADKEVEAWSHKVIGAAIEVHRHLGPGFLEVVYEKALCVEFDLRGIPFVRQHSVQVNYKERKVGEGRLDILVADKLIVELKAVNEFNNLHTAQAISYLRVTGLQLCLLINFNVTRLKHGIRRVIL